MNTESEEPIGFSIREAREGDTEEIVRLWKDLMSFHEDLDERFARGEGSEAAWRAYLRDLLTGRDSFVYVAEVGSEIVGFLSGSINEGPPVLRVRRFGWVSDAQVDGTYRRQGIGEKLFELAKEWFMERAISVIQLNVSPLNPVAESFWRKMGFGDHLERLWLDLT
jgi:ribosomal protein S18 acetylase RimI-like enzyme